MMYAYSIQLILATGILYLFYQMVLSDSRSFGFNRFYLLAILPLSGLLVYYPIHLGFGGIRSISDTSADLLIIDSDHRSGGLLSTWLLRIYIIGVLLLLMRYLMDLYFIWYLSSRGRKIRYLGLDLVLHYRDIPPFSFLGYCFIRGSDQYGTDRAIYEHERIHICQRHSWDIMFIEICRVIFWFNPFVHLIKNKIQLNHEFIADSRALSYTDRQNYQRLLLHYIADNQQNILASSINFSLTKIRFKMMNKSKSKYESLKMLLTVPILAILIIGCADSKGVSGEDMLYYWRYTAMTQQILEQGGVDESVFADGVLQPIETEAQFRKLQGIYDNMSRAQKKSVFKLPPNPIPMTQ